MGLFSLRHSVHIGSGTHPASYPMDRELFPRVKRPGRETGHYPPLRAEVKNMRNYTSTTILCLHGVVLN